MLQTSVNLEFEDLKTVPKSLPSSSSSQARRPLAEMPLTSWHSLHKWQVPTGRGSMWYVGSQLPTGDLAGPCSVCRPSSSLGQPSTPLPCPWPLPRPTVLPPPFPAIILLLLFPKNRCSHLPSTHESLGLCPSLSMVILVRAHLWGESPQVWTNLLGEVSDQAPLSLQYYVSYFFPPKTYFLFFIYILLSHYFRVAL